MHVNVQTRSFKVCSQQMKETEFVEQNTAKWRELEKELIRKGDVRPDQITDLYIESIVDLSFARTHYPNRSVRAYLNGVVEVLSLKIQRSQKNYWKYIKTFWSTDLPLAMYEGRMAFMLSFLILVVSIVIGIFSSMHDKSFANYILGDAYVQLTLENIEKGDPMAIYKDDALTDMFFGITINNILVSVKTFILSLFFGFGTILVMIYNGIMLGVFQYFFIERGLFFESFLTIWQHGTIEISCIVLAGTAGLVLAKGILFPASYSRLDSFRINGRKSLMIMLGLMPLLVLSGAIEAFVTRFTEVHWAIRLLSILISLSFVLFYFVWYPRRVAKGENKADDPSLAIQPIRTSEFSVRVIQNGVSVFWESVRILFVGQSWYVRGLLGITLLMGISWWRFGVNSDGSVNPIIADSKISTWFIESGTNLLFIFSTFSVSMAALLVAHSVVFQRLGNETEQNTFRISWPQAILVSLVLSLAITAGLTYAPATVFLVLALPFLGLFFVLVFHHTETEFSIWKRTWMLTKRGFGRIIAVFGICAFANLLISVSAQSLFTQVLDTFLSNYIIPEGNQFLGSYLIPALFVAYVQFTFVALVYISFHLMYFTLHEIQSASVLTQRINSVFPTSHPQEVEKAALLRNEVFSL